MFKLVLELSLLTRLHKAAVISLGDESLSLVCDLISEPRLGRCPESGLWLLATLFGRDGRIRQSCVKA
jgi:hypothetical protein